LHSFEVGQFSLVIIGMVTSVVSTYYYLRIIKVMWFEKPIPDRFIFKTNLKGSMFNIYILIECILVLFFVWSPWTFILSNILIGVAIHPLTSI